MAEFFVNLKRFEVPRGLGGVCGERDPKKWIQSVMRKTLEFGLGRYEGMSLTFLLPEALVIPAAEIARGYLPSEKGYLHIGCQSVYRDNVTRGGNFGAFTSLLPASAAANMGCTWTMIGHSEERKDKFDIIAAYDPMVRDEPERMKKTGDAISTLLNRAVLRALESDMNVLFCVGETAEERGGGTFDQQKPRIAEILQSQLEMGLKGIEPFSRTKKIVIAYEPRWAIGPGKTPPGTDYIEFVSGLIKEEVKRSYGYEPAVVYGGGLKVENAKSIAGIRTIDGGLIALTRFTGEIGFEPEGLRSIIQTYLGEEAVTIGESGCRRKHPE